MVEVVPKLEFGEKGNEGKGTFCFLEGGGISRFGGGGLETNKGRARGPRGCRSFKEGCHALAAPEP